MNDTEIITSIFLIWLSISSAYDFRYHRFKTFGFKVLILGLCIGLLWGMAIWY